MFDINTRLTKTSNYILLFWFYVRSVPLVYGTGTIGWQNSALDHTSILFIKFQFYCGRFAALQNWGILDLECHGQTFIKIELVMYGLRFMKFRKLRSICQEKKKLDLQKTKVFSLLKLFPILWASSVGQKLFSKDWSI